MKTTEQLDEARLGMIDFFKKEGMLNIEERITCDKCMIKHDCDFAYDIWNIDDDCLASK